MTPLTAREFWSLSRDERGKRITYAVNNDVCSACGKPILEGEARNGLHASHYDCTYLGPPPSENEIQELSRRVDSLLVRLTKNPNRR